jgi:hypothetical protein
MIDSKPINNTAFFGSRRQNRRETHSFANGGLDE